MPTVVILRGVSGSGKSTWAMNQTGYVVISRDSIRKALFGSDGEDYYKVENEADKKRLAEREHTVTLAEHGFLMEALKAGKDVIIDNTNIEWKYVKAYAKRAQKLGADVITKTFDVPLQRAINNNTWRAANGGRDVPRRVIEKQHSRLQGTKDKVLEPAFVPVPYKGTPGKPKAFLVDIDGTLAHMNGRSPYDWKRVGEDDVDQTIADIANVLCGDGYSWSIGDSPVMIVMSGRDESCRRETEVWLNKHYVGYDELFMRPEGDMRPDNIVKAELFDKYVRDNYDVKFVLDDRNQVVDMWRQMGLKVLQVEDGDF